MQDSGSASNDLKDIEEKINLSRRYYNGTVRQFNTAIYVISK
ncbi:MAG: LemA family protein [Bacteroidetes bacterium]|nr:LemA family protein [Bacteroidota bacterium]